MKLSTNFGTREASEWKPFAHIWCNAPTQTEVAVSETAGKVQSLENNVNQLTAALSALMAHLNPSQAPAPSVEPAPAPVGDEPPF